MNLDEEIAKVAGLIGDKTRSAILIALMEGKALTAGEKSIIWRETLHHGTD